MDNEIIEMFDDNMTSMELNAVMEQQRENELLNEFFNDKKNEEEEK